MPATVAALTTHLGLTPDRPVDQAALADAVEAANDWVASVRRDLPQPDPTHPWDSVLWPARCDRAAVIEAARLYGRRGSVQGVAAFAEAGVTLLAKMDPSVRQLLELGEFQKSVVS